MPRSAREKSVTGIYHAMLRGINQQLIFEDDEDCEKFLEVIADCKIISGFNLYAYCLMGNHVHLLIKTNDESLEHVFKRIGVRYVYWYNWKYQRIGHLFQDRFKSESIENDRYFLTVLRYIHQNPIKAKLCNSVEKYKWSSYCEYIGERKFVDCDFALEMIGVKQFINFNSESNNDSCLENDAKLPRLSDYEVKALMKGVCDCDTVESFLKLDSNERKFYIRKLKSLGIPSRQISRLTGVSKGTIGRA